MPKDEAISDIREEHIKRVYEVYAAKSKEFQRTFNGLILFALVFIFIIALPFVSLRAEQRQLVGSLERLQVEIEPIEKQIANLSWAQTGIQKLSDLINGGPDGLRAYIAELDEECSATDSNDLLVAQDPGREPCPTEKDKRDAWMGRMVEGEVRGQFSDYQTILSQEVLDPLQTMQTDISFMDVNGLAEGLNGLESAFSEILAENPNFWRKFNDKVNFYSELDGTLGGVWGSYEKLIENENAKLTLELGGLEEERQRYEEQQRRAIAEEEKIAGRLEEIEFPFGKIPIGLEEAVAAFPLLLSIGFYIYASLLRDTMRARASFQNFYQQKDPTKQVVTDQQITIVAPLPLDPLDKERNKVAQFAIFLLPFLLFLLACGLVVYHWGIAGDFIGGGLNEWFYGGFYILGFGLFVYGYLRVIAEWRR